MIPRIIWPTTIDPELRRELDRFVDLVIRELNALDARVTTLEP